jgi:hypothetical protein
VKGTNKRRLHVALLPNRALKLGASSISEFVDFSFCVDTQQRANELAAVRVVVRGSLILCSDTTVLRWNPRAVEVDVFDL